jgi:hypothetical protein
MRIGWVIRLSCLAYSLEHLKPMSTVFILQVWGERVSKRNNIIGVSNV